MREIKIGCSAHQEAHLEPVEHPAEEGGSEHGGVASLGIRPRKIGDDVRLVCAAPSYLERHGVPTTPSELSQHACLTYAYPAGDEWSSVGKQWPLSGPEGEVLVPLDRDAALEALKRRDFDAFLLAGRYTLLEQEALNDFLPLCEARGAAGRTGSTETSPLRRIHTMCPGGTSCTSSADTPKAVWITGRSEATTATSSLTK